MMALSAAPSTSQVADTMQVHRLVKGDEKEALAFLSARPIHTVMIASFARVNGLDSALNRGVFYACRDAQGQIEGLALIGHYTLMETRCEEALAAFARLAQAQASLHVISGEEETLRLFWTYYSAGATVPHSLHHSLLLEQCVPRTKLEAVQGLRLATHDDLDCVVAAHAEVMIEELGLDPRANDPIGFRQRCARRIAQGLQWVWIEQGRLIFKADVAAHTPEVIYLEGVYVPPAERGKNYGLRCVSHLSRRLLARARSVCLLVDERNLKAQALYCKAGYKFRSRYATIYLEKN